MLHEDRAYFTGDLVQAVEAAYHSCKEESWIIPETNNNKTLK